MSFHVRASQSDKAEVPPPLDAHAHLDPQVDSAGLTDCGAVLAMTIALEEALSVVGRREPLTIWGVGCHPRLRQAQDAFDIDSFAELVQQTPIVGEIGLDARSRVPLDTQLQTFRRILAVVERLPRLVSIHSDRATRLIVEELRRVPVAVPVLHWWTGTVEETREAVAIGCYFSVHSAVARQSKWRTTVPPERILVESDHGYRDPPAAIPARIQWVEHLLAQQLKVSVTDVRHLVWRNLRTIVRDTRTERLWPGKFQAVFSDS